MLGTACERTFITKILEAPIIPVLNLSLQQAQQQQKKTKRCIFKLLDGDNAELVNVWWCFITRFANFSDLYKNSYMFQVLAS